MRPRRASLDRPEPRQEGRGIAGPASRVPRRRVEQQPVSGARRRDVEQTFLFEDVVGRRQGDGAAGAAVDHAIRHGACRPLRRTRHGVLVQPHQVDGWELQPLAGVDGHEPHGVDALCREGDLSQIPLVRELDEAPDRVEGALDRLSGTGAPRS